jgi:hypothetical protein
MAIESDDQFFSVCPNFFQSFHQKWRLIQQLEKNLVVSQIFSGNA